MPLICNQNLDGLEHIPPCSIRERYHITLDMFMDMLGYMDLTEEELKEDFNCSYNDLYIIFDRGNEIRIYDDPTFLTIEVIYNTCWEQHKQQGILQIFRSPDQNDNNGHILPLEILVDHNVPSILMPKKKKKEFDAFLSRYTLDDVALAKAGLSGDQLWKAYRKHNIQATFNYDGVNKNYVITHLMQSSYFTPDAPALIFQYT